MSFAQTGPPKISKVHFEETGGGLLVELIQEVDGNQQLEAHGDVNFLPEGVLFDWTGDGTTGIRYLIPWSNIKRVKQNL